MPESAEIITMRVDVTDRQRAVDTILGWATDAQSRYVCVSNVHMCIETYNDPAFRTTVNTADLTVPDGRPIFWAQKLLGHKNARQVRGMDLTLSLCERAAQQGISVGFYGGAPATLQTLQSTLQQRFPQLKIAFAISPPFRPLTQAEQDADIAAINSSNAGLVFVGLGCPKQERWMQEHRDKVNAVMLGVGAAFDFIAGNKKHAPNWMQTCGLEWFYRLLDEPKRLWRRYLYTNPKFIGLFVLQLLGKRFPPK